ncbi:MAG TPA: hypothetical protein VG097_20940 [Gemmata sp.]|nr:hypothetical protein [Gemmata sp.]
MRQMILAATIIALAAVTVAMADDLPKREVQPSQFNLNPQQLGQPRVTVIITRLEEEVELLEARRDIRRAYEKAATVGVKSAKVNFERIGRLVQTGVITREESDKAKLDVEAAEAQLEIRVAEMKEVDVKIKYAKKRLDETLVEERLIAVVSGTVSVDGKPIEKGSISFLPVDGVGVTIGGSIEGGKYTLSRVPFGPAKVEIRVPKVTGKKKLYDTPDSPTRDTLSEVLPNKYNVATELRFNVQPGKNEKNWDLSTK